MSVGVGHAHLCIVVLHIGIQYHAPKLDEGKLLLRPELQHTSSTKLSYFPSTAFWTSQNT